jgi:hypothetical protein
VRIISKPRDLPPAEAARRLGIDLSVFNAKLPNLFSRGFPQPDPDTGLYDMVAIDRWCDARHPHLFGGEPVMQARDASTIVKDRIARMGAATRRG